MGKRPGELSASLPLPGRQGSDASREGLLHRLYLAHRAGVLDGDGDGDDDDDGDGDSDGDSDGGGDGHLLWDLEHEKHRANKQRRTNKINEK